MEIQQELCTAKELAKLHKLRLSRTLARLSAVEDLLREARARFRAKGIPIVDPRYLPPHWTLPSMATKAATTTILVDHTEPGPVANVNMNVEVSPPPCSKVKYFLKQLIPAY
jgi:hypothetical protein